MLTAIAVCPTMPQVEEYLPRTLADLLRDLRAPENQRQTTIFVSLSVATQVRLHIDFDSLTPRARLRACMLPPSRTGHLVAVLGTAVPAQPQNPPSGRQAGQRAHLREPNKGPLAHSLPPPTLDRSRLSPPCLGVRLRVLSPTRQKRISDRVEGARHTGNCTHTCS